MWFRSRPLSDERMADIYDAAADYIIAHGWTQTTDKDSRGRVCARGALKEVTSRWTYRKIEDELPGMNSFAHMSSLVSFNDASLRSAQEIIRVFRTAAFSLCPRPMTETETIEFQEVEDSARDLVGV